MIELQSCMGLYHCILSRAINEFFSMIQRAIKDTDTFDNRLVSYHNSFYLENLPY